MSIDREVKKPTQLKFDFMKIERSPPKENSSSRRFESLVTGLTLLAVTSGPVLAAGYLVYASIPERPPRVQKSGNTLHIEPYTYSGNYLTRHSNDSTIVMLVDGFWKDGPYRWYRANRRGIVTEITGDLGDYILEKDFTKHPEVFAKAQKDFNKVLEEYKPHIEKFDQAVQLELMF